MNIVKRLLNIVMLYGVLACCVAVYEWGNAAIEYKFALEDQAASCEKQTDLDRRIAEQEALPPSQRKPIFRPDVSYKYLCERKIERQIFIYGKNDFGLGIVILLAVAVLNYILFGKATLWNRVPHVEKSRNS